MEVANDKGHEMTERKIRELTTGVHDFPTLINGKETKYVDKTAILHELARKEEDAQYFLSRPRRFGKSLMLSTLQAMFEGRRDLFKGLAIHDMPWEGWDEKNRHPVYNFPLAIRFPLASRNGLADNRGREEKAA